MEFRHSRFRKSRNKQKNWGFHGFQIRKVGIQSKKLRKNGRFGDLRFKKLAFRQRIYEKMVNLLISDLKNDNFGDLRFKKLAFNQRIYEKMVNFLISDLKNDNFGDLRFKKLAFRQRIYEKMVNLVIFDDT